jgi:ABC-2 type transport system ATP-binding protein
VSVAVEVIGLEHHYGKTIALAGVDFSINHGEIFGLLGPNGGGKSTTFKILSTSIIPTKGVAKILGRDIAVEPMAVRKHLGIVFQSPALDKKLTVKENLMAQGHLYGLSGKNLPDRLTACLARVGLTERMSERVEKLSGGLQRRVEIAKAMLHDPEVFILDEPTTGLDPIMRREVWNYLQNLRRNSGKTVCVTTHLLEEAEGCDRIGILHRGKMVALGTPAELKAELGDDVIAIKAQDPLKLKEALETKFSFPVQVLEGEVRVEKKGHEFISPLVSSFGDSIQSIQLRKPTLEDLFIRRTGERMGEEGRV